MYLYLHNKKNIKYIEHKGMNKHVAYKVFSEFSNVFPGVTNKSCNDIYVSIQSKNAQCFQKDK